MGFWRFEDRPVVVPRPAVVRIGTHHRVSFHSAGIWAAIWTFSFQCSASCQVAVHNGTRHHDACHSVGIWDTIWTSSRASGFAHFVFAYWAHLFLFPGGLLLLSRAERPGLLLPPRAERPELSLWLAFSCGLQMPEHALRPKAESVTRRLNLSWFAEEESLSELLGWIYPNPQGYESLLDS